MIARQIGKDGSGKTTTPESIERLARIRHLYPRHGMRDRWRRDFRDLGLRAQWLDVRGCPWQLTHDGSRAALQCGGDEAITVCFLASNGDKKGTGRGLATVVN